MLLAACSAKSGNTQNNNDQAENPDSVVSENPAIATTDEIAPPAETNNPNPPAAPKPEEKTTLEPEQPIEVVPLVTFIELGAESCIPCRMMQPVMRAIELEYKGLVKVIFHDLNKERWAGPQYKVRVMPTQVFLDMDGREFFRHEGFYPKEEIERMLAEKIGVTKPKSN
ncbi:MAG: thioredoxin family protein [Candidatus Syntrophosphaera sp.]|nr:thioredoxin family protein [Candidatus Syntrophosphaera sp.]